MSSFILKRRLDSAKLDPEKVAEHKIHYFSLHNNDIYYINIGFSFKIKSNSSKITTFTERENNFEKRSTVVKIT